MAKPSGPICNLDCTYCYYLEKKKLYPSIGQRSRMSSETLEQYVKQYVEAQDAPSVNFVWQGGEPTLMGLEFFQRAIELQRRYANGKQVNNAIQTNGVLLDDRWGRFLAENGFLVGISIDGPRAMHDRHRADKGGKPTFDRVMAGLSVLSRHKVEFNTLTVISSHNAGHPLEVYRFLKSIGSHFMQFIPVVERAAAMPEGPLTLVGPRYPGTAEVTPWSITAEQYGAFLNTVFDYWVRDDVGRYFVQIFDATLASFMGQNPELCIFTEICGDAMIIEHNGDLYSCDHYVYPDYNLGNVHKTTIRQMAQSERQSAFGLDKRDSLPQYCQQCEFRFACNGGCPKQRFATAPDGAPGLSYFCAGYKAFFSRAAPYMRMMREELLRRRPASGVMARVLRQDTAGESTHKKQGRNDACYCGSGKKSKRCHDR